MMPADEHTQLQLRSIIRSDGQLELSLHDIAVPRPGPTEVLVRVEAAPLNPSDLGLLFGTADMTTAVASGTRSRPVITAQVAPAALRSMTGRLDRSMPIGNEGAGVVVGTGDSAAARALEGRTVAILGGAMYSQYRCVDVDQCLVLPPGTKAADGASSFVNPMTALGMVDTLRSEGHRALVHTAAASNLGQMLHRLCVADGIPLVNIVRSDEQESLLRGLGAVHVCSTGSPRFTAQLDEALLATGATLAFDAIGGGPLAGQILSAMERVASRDAKIYSRYGSTLHKQVYLYGGLDPRPTELVRDFGMAWGVGGWLVMAFMQKVGPAAVDRFKQRIVAELHSTFASKYSREISLAEMLQPDVIDMYRKRATGQKFLINPNRGL